MTIDLRCDGHVHTSLCHHAKGAMEEYVQSAIKKGLHEIIFLEHLEEGINYFERTWLTEEDFDRYFSEGARLKTVYQDSIKIGLGVEVGYNPDAVKEICNRLAQRKWDRIGLSYHFLSIGKQSQHLNLLSSQQNNLDLLMAHDPSELLSHYFDTLIDAVQVIDAQVLCHLDAGLRHLPGRQLNNHHYDQIRSLLDEVKRAGMAVEINTSGFNLRSTPYPPPDIIRQAQIRGIPLVAGSDAHRPADVGRFFDRLPELLTAETHP